MEIGDLVAHDLDRCTHYLCHAETKHPSEWVGVVTEKWIDEDDTHAFIIDTDVGPIVFRESSACALNSL